MKGSGKTKEQGSWHKCRSPSLHVKEEGAQESGCPQPKHPDILNKPYFRKFTNSALLPRTSNPFLLRTDMKNKQTNKPKPGRIARLPGPAEALPLLILEALFFFLSAQWG